MTGKVKGKLGGVAGSILEKSNSKQAINVQPTTIPPSTGSSAQSSYLTISDSSRTQVTQAPIKIPRTSYAKTLKKVSQ